MGMGWGWGWGGDGDGVGWGWNGRGAGWGGMGRDGTYLAPSLFHPPLLHLIPKLTPVTHSLHPHPTHLHPIQPHPIQPRPVPPRSIPSRPIPSDPVRSRPIPSDPIPLHPPHPSPITTPPHPTLTSISHASHSIDREVERGDIHLPPFHADVPIPITAPLRGRNGLAELLCGNQ